MIPTEKVRSIFVCYVKKILFDVFTAYGCTRQNKKITVNKQSKLVRLHCSSCGDIIETSLQPFTVFIKLTLAEIIILWLLKSGITMLIHYKDDIEFITEFPCLLGHPVSKCNSF